MTLSDRQRIAVMSLRKSGLATRTDVEGWAASYAVNTFAPDITALHCLVIACALAFTIAPSHAQQSSGLQPLDASGRIMYFIGQGTQDAAWRASDQELAVWALKAWERSADGKLRLEAGPESTATIRVRWVPANGGGYGEMQPLIVNGRRGAVVFIRPDTEALGADIAGRAREDPLFRETIVYLTCLHELGHALGLSHTSDYRDIMYFFGYGGDIVAYFGRYRDQLKSRDDIARVSGLSAGDVNRLKTLYAR
jgi:hypothetical protein